MGSTAATMLLLGFLVPTIAVFVISYRHALRTWLAPPAVGHALPIATIVGHRPAPPSVPMARRFHAAIIGVAFASVFTMGLIAAALIAITIVSA